MKLDAEQLETGWTLTNGISRSNDKNDINLNIEILMEAHTSTYI